MKLKELHEAVAEKTTTKGTYVAVKFSKDTIKRIKRFRTENNIPNPVPSERFHTTVIYSRKHLPDFKSQGAIDPPWIGKPKKLDIFTSQDGNNCLVLVYDCKELTERHESIMEEHEATYDFPEYHAHITLSYNCGDLDPKSVKGLHLIGDIEIVNEYDEDLNLKWAEEKGGA